MCSLVKIIRITETQTIYEISSATYNYKKSRIVSMGYWLIKEDKLVYAFPIRQSNEVVVMCYMN